MPAGQWFVVANATRARVLARTEDGHLEPVHSFEHPESRRKTSELGDDKAGRELSGRGFGGAAFEPRLDPHRKEHRRFAHELAEFLEREALSGAYTDVSIFAASPFLGELKQELGSHTEHCLAAACDVDLSAVGPAELDRRIRQVLAH